MLNTAHILNQKDNLPDGLSYNMKCTEELSCDDFSNAISQSNHVMVLCVGFIHINLYVSLLICVLYNLYFGWITKCVEFVDCISAVLLIWYL